MTVLSIAPLVPKEWDLLIGAAGAPGPDDFGAHATNVVFEPTTSTVTWTGGKGNTYADATTPTWNVKIDYAQDWDSANSLSRYLLAHAGEHLPVKFTPSDAGPSFSGTVIVSPGAIGGAINAVATASVTLPMEGQPVLTEAV